MRTRVIRTVLLTVAGMSLLLSGCSEEPGLPTPNSSTPNQPDTSVASSSAPGGTGLAGMSACELMTATEAKPLGITKPSEDSGELAGTGTSRCQWMKDFEGGEGGFTLSIVVRPEQGIDSVRVDPGWTSENGEFEGRQARILKQERAGGGSCLLAIEVSKRSRVDVGATGDSTDQTCGLVNDVATIVEPKLPKDGG